MSSRQARWIHLGSVRSAVQILASFTAMRKQREIGDGRDTKGLID